MKKRITIIIGILLLLITLGTISYIFSNNYTNNETIYNDTKIIEDVFSDKNITHNQEIIDTYRKNYHNQEVVGEISFLNTDYRKAIMQASDNDYYLNHTENKTASYMGAIYIDFRTNIDNDKKLLIYGHNSARVDMPFKIIEKYYNYEYYNNHKYIKITTENKTRLYKIYSIYVEVEDFSYMQTDFNNTEEWYQHISNLKKKSMYETNESVNNNDNILILQTCSTHSKYKDYDHKFLLIVAKEVSENKSNRKN